MRFAVTPHVYEVLRFAAWERGEAEEDVVRDLLESALERGLSLRPRVDSRRTRHVTLRDREVERRLVEVAGPLAAEWAGQALGREIQLCALYHRWRRHAAGLCSCGAKLPSGGVSFCQRCAARYAAQKKRRRDGLRVAQLCVVCGKAPPVEGYVRCESCGETARDDSRAHNARRRKR